MKQICFLCLFLTLVYCASSPTTWWDYGGSYQGVSSDTYSANAIPYSGFAAPTHATVSGLLNAYIWNLYASVSFLPAPLNPTCQHSYSVQAYPNQFARVDVSPNGIVSYQGGTPGPNWLSLGNIFYPLSSTSYAPLTLQSGWSNQGGHFCNVSYYVENGLLYLQGTVITTTPVTLGGFGSAITVLPVSPSLPIYHSVPACCNPEAASILINTDGTVYLFTLSQSGSFSGSVALDGIVVPYVWSNWVACSLNSPWYGSCYYMIDGTMVFVTGVIYNWNQWSSTPLMFTLPSGARPPAIQLFMGSNYYNNPGVSNTARIDVFSTGQVQVTGVSGATGGITLNNIRFLI